MKTTEIIFLLITAIVIIHEIRKIKDSAYIFKAAKEIKRRINDGLDCKIHEDFPKYESVILWDLIETIYLFFGAVFFSSQWYCFFAIIILSFSSIQKISINFFRIDAIITILILIFAILDRFIL